MDAFLQEGAIRFRQVKSIYLKEFFQILLSPMFLVIVGACCLFWSFTYIRSFFLFSAQNLSLSFQQNAEGINIHYAVFIPLASQLNLLLIFIAPALTMRLFSEEKKLNTFDLLMSAPLSSGQIVCGKFLAAFSSVALLISISFLYIVLTAFFADFNWVMPLLTYLGVLLVGGVYTALGLFASALTRSVVLSVTLGLILNLGAWFISQSSDLIDYPIFSSIMNFFSVADHLINFGKGTIVISSFSFFLIVIFFFVFLTRQVIEVLRWR